MTLDDVYGSEHDRFPLEQERSPVACALDWGDTIERYDFERYGIANGARRPVSSQACAISGAAAPQSPVAVLLQAPRHAA
jgi:hypothetical protein